ncbi:alpha-keto acid decarboxylase family protein [Desulfogranum mediterraneum]|uniref:alpha-keto acid decarboxylase family protein n=1 Tax=Desulfogranum mediterraneum TaxID=160661 RepID=UPI0004181258|nr:thiamine pyrophosphate-binding protein [Desulfogranum mediterraneum]
MSTQTNVGEYLITKLHQCGIRHMFGIPGDYVLGFYDLVEKNPLIELINTSDEQGAGFAADAYARISGLGAVCVTYGVGGLKLANTTAQAYAEKSPVVIISGSPGMAERDRQRLLHHQITDFSTQARVFAEFTVASTVLDSPQTAQEEIDRVILAALEEKRPVYIELPRDLVFAPIHPVSSSEDRSLHSDPEALEEALEETARLINQARQPVILAGVELHRFGLQEEVVALARGRGIPVAATMLAKSVVPDSEEFYLGVFEGGTEAVTHYVESSDCLLMLGTFLSDLNLGLFTTDIDPSRGIYATSERLSIRHHYYDTVLFADFLRGLARAPIEPRPLGPIPRPQPARPISDPCGESPITVAALFQQLNTFIRAETMVVADVGDALFGANDLFVHNAADFLSPAYYASLGFAVPGALGAQLANPYARPLVLVGDGAFQMTGVELSTIARYGLNPIVVVLNNQGYSTERPMLDGAYNDVHPWAFSKLPLILGSGQGFLVHTQAELCQALAAAEKNEEFTIIEVLLDRDDRSPALNRLTAKLGARVKESAE